MRSIFNICLTKHFFPFIAWLFVTGLHKIFRTFSCSIYLSLTTRTHAPVRTHLKHVMYRWSLVFTAFSTEKLMRIILNSYYWIVILQNMHFCYSWGLVNGCMATKHNKCFVRLQDIDFEMFYVEVGVQNAISHKCRGFCSLSDWTEIFTMFFISVIHVVILRNSTYFYNLLCKDCNYLLWKAKFLQNYEII